MGNRRSLVDSDARGIRIGCSTCGLTYMFPQEIRKTSEGRYQCIVGMECYDENNRLEDSRARNSSNKRREGMNFRIPGAPGPGYR